jgi:hypothetical protein
VKKRTSKRKSVPGQPRRAGLRDLQKLYQQICDLRRKIESIKMALSKSPKE